MGIVLQVFPPLSAHQTTHTGPALHAESLHRNPSGEGLLLLKGKAHLLVLKETDQAVHLGCPLGESPALLVQVTEHGCAHHVFFPQLAHKRERASSDSCSALFYLS